MPSDAQTLDQQTETQPRKRRAFYSHRFADRFCQIIARSAKSVETICDENPSFPTPTAIYDWLDRFPEFAEQYGRAREQQAGFLALQTLEIADDTSLDYQPVTDGKGNLVGVRVDGECVQARKLRVDTRKWVAGKLAPKRWGDNIGIQVSVGDELRKLVREANAPLDVTPGRIEDRSNKG